MALVPRSLGIVGPGVTLGKFIHSVVLQFQYLQEQTNEGSLPS